MSIQTITGVLLSGHKEDALEVPFDPGKEWTLQSVQMAPGRRGFSVEAIVKSFKFHSYIVARAGHFWLLVDSGVKERAHLAVGDTVSVVLEPNNGPDA